MAALPNGSRCSVSSHILMSASEEIHRLEAELETSKQNLRQDAAQIQQKIDETKAELSPTNLVRKRSYLALGAALAAGFAVGYLFEWRKIEPKQVAGPMLEHISKSAARTIIATAGKQLVTNAIREKYHGHGPPAPARDRRI
jgi:ElaB/YqjD/DUF883 family membrane-anchored ribosome-binding protein